MIASRMTVSALRVSRLRRRCRRRRMRRRLRRSARCAGDAMSPLASKKSHAGRWRAPGAASSRSASAATSLYSTDGGRELAAVDRAGELGPDRRVLRQRQAGLGGRPRRRDSRTPRTAATNGRCSSTARAPTTADRRDGAQGRGASRRRRTQRRCSRKRSATRSKAPTSRSSTCGSPTRRTATRSARTTCIFRTRRRRHDVGAVVRPHRQPEIPQPLRDPAGGRRAVHRRRRRPRAEARRRGAAVPRGRPSRTTARFFGVDRRWICGRRLRPARQRLPQRRRAARRGPRSTPDCRRRSSARRAPRTATTLLADVGGRVAATADGGRTFATVALSATDAAHRHRRCGRRQARARRARAASRFPH